MPISMISNRKQLDFIVTYKELEPDEFDRCQEEIFHDMEQFTERFATFLEDTVASYCGRLSREMRQTAEDIFRIFVRISIENSTELTVRYSIETQLLSYKTDSDHLCISWDNNWGKLLSHSVLELSSLPDSSRFEISAAMEL